ncbi:MAG: four-carbon acid sugar kinase family protein [Bacteroidota bacterium]
MDHLPILDFAATMASLPPQQPDEGLDEAIAYSLAERFDVVIVLDDDPTGTQTVYNIPIITELTEAAFLTELQRESSLFYVLTNSRAYPTREVAEGSVILGATIQTACAKAGKRPLVIIRGDSTLRGHFDHEDRYLAAGLGRDGQRPFLLPAFFEGGRYTIGDVHYVKQGKQLVPAAQTPFAADKTFGYSQSNLLGWVKEKSTSSHPTSISLTNLRVKFPTALRDKIIHKEHDQACIINAADYLDLKRAALYILRFAARPLLRTSASFIKALLGQEDRPYLTFTRPAGRGALFLVGSHVPKTTSQLKHLKANADLTFIELDVPSLISGAPTPSGEDIATKIDQAVSKGQDVLCHTSRKLVTVPEKDDNLGIAEKVSGYCQSIVRALKEQPALLLTKGGITSSDIATKALGVKRAVALGQVQAGVPTWELGPESKFPGMPFVIYPGNVGEVDGLTSILQNTLR